MRRLLPFLLVAASAVALPVALTGQTADPKPDWTMVAKIREEGLQRSQVMDTVSYIADVLGAEQAQEFVLEAMALCTHGALAGHPVSLLEDEARMLLSRRLQQHAPGFSLVAEHAAYCHELVQAVRDALSHDAGAGHAGELAARTKAWERRADHLVMQARNLAKRQASWKPFANLVEEADEVADHLEEASLEEFGNIYRVCIGRSIHGGVERLAAYACVHGGVVDIILVRRLEE